MSTMSILHLLQNLTQRFLRKGVAKNAVQVARQMKNKKNAIKSHINIKSESQTVIVAKAVVTMSRVVFVMLQSPKLLISLTIVAMSKKRGTPIKTNLSQKSTSGQVPRIVHVSTRFTKNARSYRLGLQKRKF